MNEKGEIFELELEPVQDIAIDKEGVCICSDCATDDTGYGTDTDVFNNFSKLDDDTIENYCDKAPDFDIIDDLLNVGTVNIEETNIVGLSTDIRNIEEDIDHLFACVNVDSNSEFDTLKTESCNLPSNIEDLFADGFDELKAEKTKSKCNKKATAMTNPDSNTQVVRHGISKHSRESATNKLNDSTCSCSSKESSREGDVLFGVEKLVVLRLKYLSGDIACNTIELCEQLLGVIPGHFSSSNGSKSRKRDRRVKIRGLVPTGISAKHHDIKVG